MSPVFIEVRSGMKLQQLRYLAAVAQNGLNITAAAEKLHTSQPAVSKQIKLLEDELGFRIFVRSGRTLTKITPAGEQVVERAIRVLREVQNIKGISAELKDEERGTLSIGTTHTQARYILPPVVQQFRAKHPEVRLHLHQGTSEQIAELTRLDRVDFAIATGSNDLFSNLVLLPSYQWYRHIVVPRDHELAKVKKPTIKQLAAWPIVTYVFSFNGPSSLQQIFAKAGCTLNTALTARDADVIKTYVRLGLGVGILAGLAVDPKEDADLVCIDASHLFPIHTTWIGFTRGGLLRRYMYDFMQLFAPHLNRRLVDRAANAETPDEVERLLADVKLPVR
jgi:LysR family cys regulon transcriptional activator